MEKEPENRIEENYSNTLKEMGKWLAGYANHLSVGEHAEHRKICMDNIVECYQRAVELAKQMNLMYPEKQVLGHLKSFLESLDFLPKYRWMVERDVNEILQNVGEEKTVDFSFLGSRHEKKYKDVIGACCALRAIFKLMEREGNSAEFEKTLEENLKHLKQIEGFYDLKTANSGAVADPQMFAGFAAKLRKTARMDEFWDALDALLTKKKPMTKGREWTGSPAADNKQEMVKLLEDYINLFNRLALENYPASRKGQ